MSLGLGEPHDAVAAEVTRRVARRFKAKLLPFIHKRPTPEMRAWMKRTIMDFIWGLQRTDELPLQNPYMRVSDVEILTDPHDPRHVRLRFLDDRGELIILPM